MIFCGEQEIQQIKGEKGSGSWEKGDVYREGKTKKERWVKDKKGIGGRGGRKPRPFMHDRCLR